MYRQYVFLVHGMGKKVKGDWHEPVVDAILTALQQYAPYDRIDRDKIKNEHLRFIPVSYDDVFDGYRTRWSQLAGDVAGKISEKSPEIGEIFRGFKESTTAEAGWEVFFWESLLDPLLWYAFSEARKAVVARVNEQIGKGLREMYANERANVAHVIAHSQGTSVIHDSLVALRFWRDHEGVFDPKSHTWLTIGMLANVGRLLETRFKLDANLHREDFKVYRSVMKPRVAGSICRNYINVHHMIDPFTWPRRFRPGDWSTEGYSDIETVRFREVKEVHNFDHYFANPRVHIPLLRLITGRMAMGNVNEVSRAWADFEEAFPHSASNELDRLRDLFGRDPDKKISVREIAVFLYEAYKELK